MKYDGQSSMSQYILTRYNPKLQQKQSFTPLEMDMRETQMLTNIRQN